MPNPGNPNQFERLLKRLRREGRHNHARDAQRFYDHLEACGLPAGHAFRAVNETLRKASKPGPHPSEHEDQTQADQTTDAEQPDGNHNPLDDQILEDYLTTDGVEKMETVIDREAEKAFASYEEEIGHVDAEPGRKLKMRAVGVMKVQAKRIRRLAKLYADLRRQVSVKDDEIKLLKKRVLERDGEVENQKARNACLTRHLELEKQKVTMLRSSLQIEKVQTEGWWRKFEGSCQD